MFFSTQLPPLATLTGIGIRKDILRQLHAIGIQTVEALLFTEEHCILTKTKIPPDVLKELLASLYLSYAGHIHRGTELRTEFFTKTVILSIGPDATALNASLQGGIWTGELTEVVGRPASGKTQLCFSLALTTVSSGDCTVAYIDTSNCFSGRRLQEMYSARSSRGTYCIF
jgi:RAD51-like protein 3